MSYEERLQRFAGLLAGQADLAFFPISADLQYLAGIPRDIPNFGAVMPPAPGRRGCGSPLAGRRCSPCRA
jgi:hypothetical protein